MKIEISSPLTYIFKFIAPLINIIIIVSIAFILWFYDSMYFGPILLILFILVIGIYKSFIRLKKVLIEDDYIYISNYLKEIKIHKSEIRNIQTLFIKFGGNIKISFKNKTLFGKYIVFRPNYSLTFANLKLDLNKLLN